MTKPLTFNQLASLRQWMRISAVLAFGAMWIGARAAAETIVTPHPAMTANLPLAFEASDGRSGSAVQFIARGPGCQLLVRPDEVVLSLIKTEVGSIAPRSGPAAADDAGAVSLRSMRLKFAGANPAVRLSGREELPGKVNYFVGRDAADWRTGLPLFARVQFDEIYPGINLVLYGNQHRLEYDFVVAPKSDPATINLQFEGADQIRVDEHGDLLLRLGRDEIRQPKPVIFQRTGGAVKEIAGGYRITGPRTVRFEIGDYDAALPLVIDPVLSYSTYFGGSGSDTGWAIAVDTNGFVYVAGETRSTTLPTTPGAFQTNYGGGTTVRGDAFVAKFDQTLTNLVYLTYLGGNGNDGALGLALDGAGNAYVTGFTDSTNFPLASAIFTNISGSRDAQLSIYPADAFVSKLGPFGTNLIYSTYLGGSGSDGGVGISVDSSTNIYVAGYTSSTNFPVTGGLYTVNMGTNDAFVTKFHPDGTLYYSTLLGGTNDDVANDIAADAAGNAYVTGYTSSTNFPITNAVQTWLNTLGTNVAHPRADAFVTKLNPDGTALVYSTFLGGTSDDLGFRLALDDNASAYVTGPTRSANFPVTATNLPSVVVNNNLASDVFVAKFDTNGNTNYAVVFGGDSVDDGWDIAVDSAHNAYVVGTTASLSFPVTNAAGFLRRVNSGGLDVFVAELNPDATALVFAGYLGGNTTDVGYGVALDSAGGVYITGETLSFNFPTVAPRQAAFGGVKDAFLAKIIPGLNLTVVPSGTNVLLTWPSFGTGFVLQAATNLVATNVWFDYLGTPGLTGDVFTVKLPASGRMRYFRLRSP